MARSIINTNYLNSTLTITKSKTKELSGQYSVHSQDIRFRTKNRKSLAVKNTHYNLSSFELNNNTMNIQLN